MESASFGIPRASSGVQEALEKREIKLLVELESERVSYYLETTIERAILFQVQVLVIHDRTIDLTEQGFRVFVLVVILGNLYLEFIPEIVRLVPVRIELRTRLVAVIHHDFVIVIPAPPVVQISAIIASPNIVLAMITGNIPAIRNENLTIEIITTAPLATANLSRTHHLRKAIHTAFPRRTFLGYSIRAMDI
jgi:hypothetical protein